MRQLFMIVLSLSLSGTLVGLLILVLHPLTEKYFSKKWNYYIWLLVVARLLIPFHFDINFFPEVPAKLQETNNNTNNIIQNTTLHTAINTTPAANHSSDINAAIQPTATDSTTNMTRNPRIFIAYIWLFGVLSTLFVSILHYCYFLKTVKKNRLRILDNSIITLENFLCIKLQIKNIPAIYESSTIFSPMTIGLWNPVIFLPEGFSKEKDLTSLKLILHHELIHVARKDLLYKWIYQLLLCVHWFNPLLYQIRKQINSDCELSCDEQILVQLTTFGKQLYGNVLLDTAEQMIGYRQNVLSTTLLENKKDLKKRLNNILQHKKISRFRLLLSVCTIGITLLFTACSTVWIASDNTSSSSTKDTAFEENSLFSNIFGSKTTDTSFVYNFSSANKTSDAWNVYDDDLLLADEDIQDNWYAHYYRGGGNKIKASSFVLYGSDTFLIAHTEKDVDVKVTSSFELSEGKFKIISIAPDKSIFTINETGAETTQTISMKKGRNVLKIVGQGAKLKNLTIDYSNLKASSFGKIFYSEEEEYITQVKDGTISLEADSKAKILDALHYLDDKDASDIFHSLLNAKTDFTTEELCDFFIYSDSTLSSQYLMEALQNGNLAPLSADTISELCPYLKSEDLTELLKALPPDEFMDTFIEVLPYLNNSQSKECLENFLE